MDTSGFPAPEPVAAAPVAVPAAPAPYKHPVGKWKRRIAACDTLRDSKLAIWKENVNYRKGKPLAKTPSNDTVVVPVDWSRTKNKQAQLFYQVPEVKLRARQPQYAGAAPIFGAALNFELTHQLRIEHLMDEVLGDVINAAGIGIAVIGYEGTFEDVEMPVQDTAALSPEQIAQAQAGVPPTEMVKRPVFERYYADHIDPAQFLWPAEFVESDWQRADWLGYKAKDPKAVLVRRGWVKKDFVAEGSEQLESVNDASEDPEQQGDEKEIGYAVIFYRPYLCDPNEKDPRKINRLILVDGIDDPVEDEPIKWQEFNPETRTWIGLTSFPIKVLTLTTISGEAIPPSDSEIGRPQVKEMSKSRSQMIAQRDRSLPMRWGDTSQIDPEIFDKINKGEYQGIIPTMGPGDHAIGEVARASFPRESFEFMNIFKSDLDESWSMSPNQQGLATPGDTSATEASIMQGSANVRVEYERARVLRFFLELAEGIGALMQMFQNDQKYAEVVGPQGVKSLEPWDRSTIRGDYIFEAKPDAALRIDVGQKRVEGLNLYKMIRRDPLVNAQALLTDLMQMHGLDPQAYLVPPKEEPPKPPVVRYSFTSADFTNPLVVAISQKTSTPLTPADIKAAQAMMVDAGIPVLPPQQMPMPKPEVVLGDDALAQIDEAGQPPQHPGPPESVTPINQRYERNGMQDAA